MDFSEALLDLKCGRRVARMGWNGKAMFIFLVPGSTITVQEGRPLGEAAPNLIGEQVQYRPHIDMWTANGEVVPWIATQSDLLETDWVLV